MLNKMVGEVEEEEFGECLTDGGEDDTGEGDKTTDDTGDGNKADDDTGKADKDVMYPDQGKSPEEIKAGKDKEGGDKTPEEIEAEKKAAEEKEAEDKKTPEQKATEAKEAEDKKAADDKAAKEAEEAGLVTVETLKFPEGVHVADDIKAEFVELSNDKDMKPAEKAQAFIDLQVKLNTEAYQKRNDTWINEVQNDPKFLGETGDKLDENLAIAKKGMEALKIDGLSEYLVSSGEGNNPLFVEAFIKIGKSTSEDTFHSSSSAGASKEAKSDAEVLYGATSKT